MSHRFPRCPAVALALLLGAAADTRAELRSLEVLSREPLAEGMSFGDTGPYEKVVAVARFAVDPSHKRNQFIVDLPLAPRNGDGQVAFEADVCILMPKDPARGNGAILYDVNNRGNKLALGFFNRAPGGNDPKTRADAGDGWLFRRGYTVVWCGWIGELLPGNNRLLLRAPVATENGKPIRGVVRYETTADAPADSLPLSRREGHGSYAPTARGEKEGVLTWRLRETDERVPIPRGQWSLERLPVSNVKRGVPGTLGQVRLRVAGGCRPGYLYELVCEAEGPIVQGLGFAAARDLLSFLRHDTGRQNPLCAGGKPVIDRVHGFGVSQSGRFLRHFLYLGCNADEAGRKVFDGMVPHVAGGGLGFFNHRFAQPTRHNGQHEEHLYPGDMFPFTYGDATDPLTKRSDGILRRLRAEDPALLPKVMHTQSAAEYWHRSGSLVHTDPLATRDEALPDNVRLYAFGGTQHGPAADPPGRGIADNLLNPGDYRPLLRALLDALDAWVKDGTEPPPSAYPRIDKGTLAGWRQKESGFPALPGVRYPEVIQCPSALDHGLDFFTKGVITVEPPRKLGDYVVKVPRSGADGNDLGTLLPPEVAVPPATYTGWNLRRRDAGAEAMLVSLSGSYIPFLKTKAERRATGDPRESVEERYGNYDEYRKRFAAACDDLVRRRYLLKEDADRLLAGREQLRDLFPAAKPDEMPRVQVSRDEKRFVLGPSDCPFVPWGFNYDHDDRGRLIEDYWEDEWPTVESHFGQMKKLGANVVRVHLQLGKFMDGPDKPSAKALDRLGKLLGLAERLRLYLDLTGLGCYHKKDVPAWYDPLSEKDRWDVQARFWRAVAGRCAASPAVFCYDLMNEPVVPGGRRKDGEWLGPDFAGKHFVQFVTLDQKDRSRPDIARQWVRHLTAAIREKDRRHLITVGLVDWSLDRKGLTSGFVPDKVADDLDFVSVHLYPKKGKVKAALDTLAGFAVGKPVLVEETFPLACSPQELEEFIDGSKKHAAGWIGFYWGKPPEELRRSKTISDAMTLGWLELFQRKAKALEK